MCVCAWHVYVKSLIKYFHDMRRKPGGVITVLNALRIAVKNKWVLVIDTTLHHNENVTVISTCTSSTM